jgi:hypothetical protein
MTIPGSANPLLLASAAADADYQIERSLRFNSADSAYLSRTPASAGNRKTWTWAGWVKRSSATNDILFCGRNDADFTTAISFSSGNTLRFYTKVDFSANGYTSDTIAVYRDFSAWMHVLVAIDTTQATASNRVKLYVNGSQASLSATPTIPQNGDTFVNSTDTHFVGAITSIPVYFNGYLADIHFIDGQALDPTSFGEFDTNGIWQPIEYTGSYGTNGFHLDFADNASTTTIGYDAAGSNDWTANNLSVTAGAGNDSLVDVPTNGGETDTGAGGEVRGNYCTLNPLASAGTFSNGNLEVSVGASAETSGLGTFGLPASGMWYWEVAMTTVGTDAYTGISSGTSPTALGSSYYAYRTGGAFAGTPTPGSTPSSGASYTSGDIIGVAYDATAATLAFYKNGSLQGTFTGVPVGLYFPLNYSFNTATRTLNFGQRPFAYTAPSGFKALNTANLPAPLVTKPSDLFDVKLYTGNGSTQTISGLGFSPDLVWIKKRNSQDFGSHQFVDQVRGETKYLFSDSTNSETTASDRLTSFSSDGFTLSTASQVNNNADTYVAWTWDAGSSTVTNTQGSITSSVRANATAGFSIVTYTGTGSNATVGHGLGVAPFMFIIKNRSTSSDWDVYHGSLPSPATNRIVLQSTAAAIGAGGTSAWNSTSPTSTVVSLGSSTSANANGNNHVMYCFAPVVGYSSFGSYTGNGSADGPFVYTGFRPRWIMLKHYSGSISDQSNAFWEIFDSARDPSNAAINRLQANLSNAESQLNPPAMDILSNGFKLKRTGDSLNNSGGNYIYIAFAESPFAANNRAR